MKKHTPAWYIYRMPPGETHRYEIATRSGELGAPNGEEIAGPFRGPLGFHMAYEHLKQLRAKEAQSDVN